MTNSNPTPPAPPQDLSSLLKQLDQFFTKYLVEKAPAMPTSIKEFFVKWGPYLDLLLIILMAPVILVALGITAVSMPINLMGGVGGISGIFSGLVFAATIILEIAALPGLFKRSIKSWNLLFYVTLISAVHSIIYFQIINGIVGTAISLYVLYQIKSYYT